MLRTGTRIAIVRPRVPVPARGAQSGDLELYTEESISGFDKEKCAAKGFRDGFAKSSVIPNF